MRMKKRTIPTLLMVLSLLVLVISGCTSTDKQPQSPQDSATQPEATLSTTYPLTYTDDTGVETTLAKEPQRIVCLAPPATEILCALGLEDRLVGLTAYDTYPVGITEKAEYVFSDSLNPDMEQLINLNPDLVVTSMHAEDFIQNLRNLGIAVLQLNPESIEGTYETIKKFGLITNRQEQAQKIVQDMQAKEQAIEEKVKTIKDSDRVRVWLEVDPALYTTGEGTFLHELLTKAGGINIADDVKFWAKYNEEQIIAKNPQVILITYSYYVDNAVEGVLARPAWQNIDAVANKRVYSVDSDMTTRFGPRVIDGLEIIAKALYPDLFR